MLEHSMIDDVDIVSHLLTKGYTDHMSISCGNELIFLNSFLVAAVNVVTSNLLRSPTKDLSLKCVKAKDLQHLFKCFSQQKKDFVPNKDLLDSLLLLVNSKTHSENDDRFALDQFEASNPLTSPDEQQNQSEISIQRTNQSDASIQITDQAEIETNEHNYFEMVGDSIEPVIISFQKLDEEKLKVLLDKTVNNTCGICGFVVCGLSSLRQHLKKIHGVVIHCHLCDKTFTSYQTRRKHLARSHKIGVPQFCSKCDLCGKVMRKPLFLAHLRAHEVQGEITLGLEEVPCEECGKLVHPGHMYTHMYRHKKRRKHAEIKPCEKCGKEMKAYLLPGHRFACGRVAERSICNICGKEVQTTRMRMHIRIKHDPTYKPEPEPKVNCEICGKTFTNTGLKRHMKTHDEAKECDICGAKVKKLSIHKKTVHLTEEQVKGRCPECGKGFYCLLKMEEHRMSVHLKLYPYKCRYSGCEAKYNDKGNRGCHEKKKHGMLYTQYEKLKLEQNGTEFTLP